MRNAISLAGVLWLAWSASVSAQASAPGRDAGHSPSAASSTTSKSVPPLERPVSPMLRDVSLVDAIRSIDRAAGLRLGYTDRVLPGGKRVTLVSDRMRAGEALDRVLKGTGLVVRMSADSQLTIVRGSAAGSKPGGRISGRVTDAKTRQRLTGVDVVLQGTQWHATTDTAGYYRLADLDSGSYTLLARRLGYTKVTRTVAVREDQEDTVDIAMTPTAVKLDELVTTATGRQRRRDLGNAITTIKADSVLRTAPIRSLTDLLANRVPGMSLQHTSGAPGDPARIRLRGLGSVMRGNDPVVIVDGTRVYATQSEARSGNLTNGLTQTNVAAPSPLDQIDPNIIDKIEVFKGPSAATLYGADAANGVIVVTTKRGKPGPTRWAGNVTIGRTIPAGRYPDGYFRWGHIDAGAALDGHDTEFCPLTYLRCEVDSLVRYQALNDPDMTIFGQGRRAALSLTASGGSQALTYSVTGSYSDERGLLTLPQFEVQRFRTKFNREPPDWMERPHLLKTWSVTSTVTALLGRTANVALSTTLSRSDQRRTGLENQQTALSGTYVDKVNGDYYTPLRSTGGLPGTNSYLFLRSDYVALQDYYRRTTAGSISFITGLTASWQPRSWFNAAGQAGLNVVPRDDESFLPGGLLSPTDSGSLARGTGRSLVSTFGLRGTVRRPLKWGFIFETNVGADLSTQSTADLISSATGLVPGTSSLAGARSFTATDARVNTSSFGWYLEPRISGQRISLSTGLRLDGGSTYGARLTRTGGGLFGGLLGLPKLNGSWVVSEEPWFPFSSIFSSLRLRAAYGQAQVQPGATDRLRLYSRRVDGTADLLNLDQLGNLDLRPERSTEIEGGFDADLLDSRVSLELTAYRKVQVDALMPVRLPGSVDGGGMVIQNIGNIRNTGLELTAGLTPVRSPFLTWSLDLNFNRNSNTLVKLGSGVEPNPAQGIVAGYPVGGRWSLPIVGFADRNGDGVIQGGEVQLGDAPVFMGRLLPAYTSALFSKVSLLNAALQVTAGFSYDAGATQIDQTAKDNFVMSRALSDPTTPLEQQAAFIVNDRTDYGLTQTVSTFRFHSLSVNYRAPAAVTHLLRAQELTVALQGANLGLHTTYRGKDPDVTAWSPTERIVDTGQIAVPRTWQLAFFFQY